MNDRINWINTTSLINTSLINTYLKCMTITFNSIQKRHKKRLKSKVDINQSCLLTTFNVNINPSPLPEILKSMLFRKNE